MQADLADMGAEGSSAVMVLAVNVVGNRSANGDEAGAGSDGKEPSLGEKHLNDVAEADAALAADHARGLIEPEDAVKAAAVDQFASGVETRVAVTAAKAMGEQGAGRGSFEYFRHLVVPRRLVDLMMRSLRVTAPRENSLGWRRGCALLAQGCGGLSRHTKCSEYKFNNFESRLAGNSSPYQFMCIMLAAMTAVDARATP